MSTTPQAIRQAIETRVSGTTLTDTSTPLSLSLFPHLLFRDSARSPRHMEYAVGTSTSENIGDRSKPGGTALVRTNIVVSVAYQMAKHDPDIDPILVLEDDIRLRVHSQDASYPATFQIMWKRSDRYALGPPGWIVIEQTFDALHYMSV